MIFRYPIFTILIIFLIPLSLIGQDDEVRNKRKAQIDSLKAVTIPHPVLQEIDDFIMDETKDDETLNDQALDLRAKFSKILKVEEAAIELRFYVDHQKDDLSIVLKDQVFTYGKEKARSLVKPVNGAVCMMLPKGYRSRSSFRIEEELFLLTLEIYLLKS